MCSYHVFVACHSAYFSVLVSWIYWCHGSAALIVTLRKTHKLPLACRKCMVGKVWITFIFIPGGRAGKLKWSTGVLVDLLHHYMVLFYLKMKPGASICSSLLGPNDILVCWYFQPILAFRRSIGIGLYVLQYVPILKLLLRLGKMLGLVI